MSIRPGSRRWCEARGIEYVAKGPPPEPICDACGICLPVDDFEFAVPRCPVPSRAAGVQNDLSEITNA